MSAGLSCSGTLMKCVLFIFNFFFWLCGCGMVGSGIWLLVDDNVNDYLEIINYDTDDSLVRAATYLLIGVGSVILLVGFLGCCGACRESSWMLCLYSLLCLFCLLGELAVAILAVIYKDEVTMELEDRMATQVKEDVQMNEYENPSATTAAWNTMQTELECCGSTNYKDYRKNDGYNNVTSPVPLTCCVLTNDDETDPKPLNEDLCYEEASSKSPDQYLHATGCHEALYDWLDERLWIFIGLGFGIALIQMLGIVFACCIRKEITGDADFS